ncbi:MAG: tetratricopeptide repeat protein [Verrucomicrobiales bacterium]
MELPENLETLFDDASGDVAIGDLAAAAEKFQQITVAAPDHFDGWHAFAMTLMKLGRYPEAIEAGLSAVRLQPQDQLAWSSLSLFYVRDHRIKQAEAAGAKARILSWGGQIKDPEQAIQDILALQDEATT